MAPFGLALLIAATWRSSGRSALAWGVALALPAAWYGLSWAYFGSPLPRSVLRKLDGSFGHVQTGWYLRVAFWTGSGRMLTVLAVLGCVEAWRRYPRLLPVGLPYLASHALAYTVRPPAERWERYAAQVQPVLCLLAALGIAFLLRMLRLRHARWWAPAVLALSVGGFVEDRRALRAMQQWTLRTEADRVAAGRWIAAHLPSDAVVATHSGLVAYHAKRPVLDLSSLTRPLGSEDVVGRDRPEVLVSCPLATGVAQSDFVPRSGYQAAAVFTTGLTAARPLDYYVVVQVRIDVPIR